MNGNSRDRLISDLKDETARREYVEGHVRAGIAYQIRAMRDARGWSQETLGQRTDNKPQSTIARYENPDYGRFSVSTLLEIAAAFDVALLVRFVTYGELLRSVTYSDASTLAPANFADDPALRPRELKLPNSALAQQPNDQLPPWHGFEDYKPFSAEKSLSIQSAAQSRDSTSGFLAEAGKVMPTGQLTHDPNSFHHAALVETV